jgi:hypothetical protein
MKYALARRIFRLKRGMCTRFIKSPTFGDLKTAFERMRTVDKRGAGEFVYFSDDSTLVIAHDGKIHRFNLDIAKCDGSHTGAIFQALIAITPLYAREAMTRIVDQCKLGIKVKSSCGTQKLRLKPIEATLYSGWGGTTIINNLACLMIATGIEDELHKLPLAASNTEIDAAIISGAAAAGYEMSVERCQRHEDIQFLKHSPVQDLHGEYVPVLNPGVLLRTIGTSKISLHGKTDEETTQNATAYTGALLHGMYPRVRNPWIDAMKNAYDTRASNTKMQARVEKSVTDLANYKVCEGEEMVTVSDELLFLRYDLAPHEILSLYDLTRGVGFHHHSSALAKIIAKDYGLGMIDELFPGSTKRG